MKNKVVLVTGASSGIGKEISEVFLNNDYIVYGTSRKAVFNESSKSNQVMMIPMDVESESSIKEAVELISKREAGIDILINCAGSGIAGSIEGVPIQKCIEQFNVNFLV